MKITNKKQACQLFGDKCNHLIDYVKSLSNQQIKQSKINNQIMNKIFKILLYSKESKYLHNHVCHAYDQFNQIDTNYLSIDYCNDTDTVYTFDLRIERVNFIGHEWAKQYFNRSKRVNKQLYNLRFHHYKYLHYGYKSYNRIDKNVPKNDPFRVENYGGEYTNFSVINKPLILKFINMIKYDGSYNHIVWVDSFALKSIVGANQIFCKMKLPNSKSNLQKAQKRLNNFDNKYKNILAKGGKRF